MKIPNGTQVNVTHLMGTETAIVISGNNIVQPGDQHRLHRGVPGPHHDERSRLMGHGDGMNTATWEFEGADPEVGIFSASVVHTCTDDTEPAEETSLTLTTSADGKHVNEQRLFTCPVCGATTTTVDQFPIWMFEEGR